MQKKTLTNELLTSAKISDISIQKLPSGKHTLILVTQDENTAETLYEILNEHPYHLEVTIEDNTGQYNLEFRFIESDFAMMYKTGKSEQSYPPVEKFKNKEITHITTGVWEKNTEIGRNCMYLEPIRLGELDIPEALGKARGVQFVTADSPEQPSAVILTFDDFEHVHDAEADEAYNMLLDLTQDNPNLEITVDDNLLTLRIWDILTDLDLKIENLAYDSAALKQFLATADPKAPLAFALGFLPPEGKKALMAATKPGDIELITFFGYVLNNK